MPQTIFSKELVEGASKAPGSRPAAHVRSNEVEEFDGTEMDYLHLTSVLWGVCKTP